MKKRKMNFESKTDGMKISDIINVTGGTPRNINENISNTVLLGVCTDTRESVENMLFVALVGENFDGHSFVEKAFERGAVCALCQREICTDKPYIITNNTVVSYGKIAAWHRLFGKASFIGITGSVGKTTTKEAVSAVLGAKMKVLKTEGNFNNEIGVP
ncbi:MAG: hypothetical protein KBS59_02170 [Clostridiales bacterium]|nr:hypothetical protein [Clostridiales bacterium]